MDCGIYIQNAAQNRAGGDWYKMETQLSNFKKVNPNSKIKAEMNFKFSGDSKRPYEVSIDIFTDGNYNEILSVQKIKNP
ncbi:hypothetical protein D3C85_1224050 [compost metagenome]